MVKTVLDKKQIFQLVLENKYQVEEKDRFLSRCIDGRYKNSPNLPALAIPGADLGELAMILAASNSFGFQVDREKAFESLVEVVGGVKKFAYHTDSHHGGLALGCGHFGQIKKDIASYNLNEDDLDFLNKKLKFLDEKKVPQVVLEGEHNEAAVIFVDGDFGVYPQYMIEINGERKNVSVFVFHRTFSLVREKLLAKTLIKNKAVRFYDGEDEEWLYNALSETMENHLFETTKRLAKDLPIYNVVFKEDGNFEIKEQGRV